MIAGEILHGLNCPRCGGIVPVPEGQVIVCCPYCELRSLVRGERGLMRYQVHQKLDRQSALESLHKFLKRNWAIARDASRASQLDQALLAYLPFWVVWARAVGWAFGEEKTGSGNDTKYVPREVKITEEMSWNGAACDVGEFGVRQVPLTTQELEPFDPEGLHAAGLVFEPVGSFGDARKEAEADFEARLRKKTRLDRISQLFIRFFKRRYGLVYYPLWVLRYLYRGRAFQVVVDGYSGKVLYGKAPGNTLYRAAVLVLGMALGAILAVDASALAFGLLSNGDEDGVGLGIFLFIFGLGVMLAAYRAFRYGEQYEYRSGAVKPARNILRPRVIPSNAKDLAQWIDRLN